MNMENNNPALSIIIPVHNVEKELSRCIESALQQTYTDFEYRVINDASTDNTLKIAMEYAENDARIRVIDQAWGGVSKARNNGIKASRGRFIGFVDGDDFVSSDMYASLIEALEKHCADIACCNVDYWEDGGAQRPHVVRNLSSVMSGERFIEHVF